MFELHRIESASRAAQALQSIDLRIPPARALALIGPTGCEKQISCARGCHA
jgi:ABC-type phosphate transport system ATPase subunit